MTENLACGCEGGTEHGHECRFGFGPALIPLGQPFPHRCWSCLLGQCPGGPHEWADVDDVEEMVWHGHDNPAGQPCACPCTLGPSLGPDIEPPDIDEVSLNAQPCPVCAADGACAYDDQGRPLIHTTEGEE